jgi:ABC-type polysaccharide/polyol phosphate export permease
MDQEKTRSHIQGKTWQTIDMFLLIMVVGLAVRFYFSYGINSMPLLK